MSIIEGVNLMKINVIPRGVMAYMLMLAVISLIYYSTAALAERGGNGKNKFKGPTITQNAQLVHCTTLLPLNTGNTIKIAVGSATAQCLVFRIEITDAEPGDVFVDSIGAVWDIDIDPTVIGTGTCAITLTQPASILNFNPPDQQPEHITIVMADDNTTDCTVDIYVITVEKKNSFPVTYHPGGCDYLSEDSNMDGVTNPGTNPGFTDDFDDFPLLDGLGVPMVDWVSLNDGAKGYDASDGGMLMSARGHSYQLQPMGCDFDGDLIPDKPDPGATDPNAFDLCPTYHALSNDDCPD